jgi:hypothetical protein
VRHGFNSRYAVLPLELFFVNVDIMALYSAVIKFVSDGGVLSDLDAAGPDTVSCCIRKS